jgi:hypothetical protein
MLYSLLAASHKEHTSISSGVDINRKIYTVMQRFDAYMKFHFIGIQLMFNDSCFCVLFGPGDVVQKHFNSPALVRIWNTFLMVGWSYLQHNCSNHMSNSVVYFRVMNQFHVHGCNA